MQIKSFLQKSIKNVFKNKNLYVVYTKQYKMSIQCHCDLDYKELFTKQLVQTLGQLTAGILSTSLIIPFYSYYRGMFFGHTDSYECDDDQCIYSEQCNGNGDDEGELSNGYNSDIEDIEDIDQLDGGIVDTD